MGAAYGQLITMLRENIIDQLCGRFSLEAQRLAGTWVLKSRTDRAPITTEDLVGTVRVTVEAEGYRISDVQLSNWFVDGLVVDNREPFARFAVTNNTSYGDAIIVSVDPAGPKR